MVHYIGLTEKPSIDQVKLILEEHRKMLDQIMNSNMIQSMMELPTKKSRFLNWKINLAFLDNFRNSSLLLYNMLFHAASLNTSSRTYWKRLLQSFEGYVAASIDIYYSLFLIDENKYIGAADELKKATRALYAFINNIELLYEFLERNGVDRDKIIRKWREVDHPGQILATIHSINPEILKILAEKGSVCALGLMYGGIELPFALRSYYSHEHREYINAADIMGISFYGQKKGSTIMKQYSRDVLESAIPSAERLEDVIAPGDTAIIFDDNTMSGRTIELARDRLLTYGVHVPFCVCIRFPAENRIHQMKMRRHGGVDPYILGREIKGLVAQSPYSRIFTSTYTSIESYKDNAGVFDLSRMRIEKYLAKNGSQVQGMN